MLDPSRFTTAEVAHLKQLCADHMTPGPMPHLREGTDDARWRQDSLLSGLQSFRSKVTSAPLNVWLDN